MAVAKMLSLNAEQLHVTESPPMCACCHLWLDATGTIAPTLGPICLTCVKMLCEMSEYC
jgi:hypothetical protein